MQSFEKHFRNSVLVLSPVQKFKRLRMKLIFYWLFQFTGKPLSLSFRNQKFFVSVGKKKVVPKTKKSVAFGSTIFSDEAKPAKKPIKKVKELPAEERILLSELAKKKCSLEKVEEVLQAGANPNCRDKDDLPAILLGKTGLDISTVDWRNSLAVVNQHYKAALLLVRDQSLDLHWFQGTMIIFSL